MATTRRSSDASRAPHSLSLKVLRLAKPSLTKQHALSKQSHDATFRVDPDAASAVPATEQDDQFVLTPGLKLPSAFGAVHVGETFACTLCVNNDLPSDDEDVQIRDASIEAEMQTPGQVDDPMQLDPEGSSSSDDEASSMKPGETMQRIVRCHLADEGNYILFVTVNYTETQTAATEDEEPTTRRRTFRKSYRFPADHLIRVRIKTRPLPELTEKRLGSGHAIEAQLEKLGDESLLLESVTFNPKPTVRVKSLNKGDTTGDTLSRPQLELGDVQQVAFLVLDEDSDGQGQELSKDGKVILGQMSIRWRRAMGEAGMLNTGWLTGKKS